MRALLLFVGLSALSFTLSPHQREEHAKWRTCPVEAAVRQLDPQLVGE